MSHTPGPWEAENKLDDPDYFSIVATEATGSARKVGHVHNWSQQDWANARLIAAAPDLLAALEAQGHEPFTETAGSSRVAEAEGMAAHPLGSQWCEHDGDAWPCASAQAIAQAKGEG